MSICTAKRKKTLPQLVSYQPFITSTGLYIHDLAAFHLHTDPECKQKLLQFYRRNAQIAHQQNIGYIFESATKLVHKDWGDKKGFSEQDLDLINQDLVRLMTKVRLELGMPAHKSVLSGSIGPRKLHHPADGEMMSVRHALTYHGPQIRSLKAAGVDMITAVGLTYADEAVGLIRAAQRERLPIVVSLEPCDTGDLPSGISLHQMIAEIDAKTGYGPEYYMIDVSTMTFSASQRRFEYQFKSMDKWTQRIGGFRTDARILFNEHSLCDGFTEVNARLKGLIGTASELIDLSVVAGEITIS